MKYSYAIASSLAIGAIMMAGETMGASYERVAAIEGEVVATFQIKDRGTVGWEEGGPVARAVDNLAYVHATCKAAQQNAIDEVQFAASGAEKPTCPPVCGELKFPGRPSEIIRLKGPGSQVPDGDPGASVRSVADR